MIHVAIVGSGPTGCFVAEFLAKKHQNIQIDIFDRLPTPYGLARAGVAPDHQQTKRIIQQFERTLSRENVRFIGNIEIGRSIPVASLKQHYHAIVLATGAFTDRPLAPETPTTTGIYGSGHFAGWYNSHPDHCLNPPILNGSAVAIIGNGNVALDIARILAKTDEELSTSDINPQTLEAIRAAAVSEVYIIGRRGLEHASFTNMELTELASLKNCNLITDTTRLPEHAPETADAGSRRAIEQNIATLSDSTQQSDPGKQAKIELLFNYSLEAISCSDNTLQAITLKDNSAQDKRRTLNIQTLISAIGYTSQPIQDIPFDIQLGRFMHDEGMIEPGIYCAGWCKRGPQGVIPTNRSDANATGKRILADLEQATDTKAGFSAIKTLLSDLKPVFFNDWQKIDDAEQSAAIDQSPRMKFRDLDAMLAQIN